MRNRQENKIGIELKSKGDKDNILWFYYDLGEMGGRGEGIDIDDNVFTKLSKLIKKNKKLLGIEYINIKEAYDSCWEVLNYKETFNIEREISNEYYSKTKTYIMKDSHNNLYKIGKSINPRVRERTLQSEKPSIKIVKVFDKDIERKLHKDYSKHRVRGEWFELNKIQVKYICTKY